MGMLVFGMHLSYASRNAASVFHERRFLCSALIVEAIVSGPFYILRAVAWPHLHPDMAFVAYVARSQLSNTVVLMLLFLPKVLHASS
jgi:G protein-coupled receptor 158